MDIVSLKKADYAIRSIEGDNIDSANVKIIREWSSNTCSSKLINTGFESVYIKEVVLFTGELDISQYSEVYGEGYNILSQYAGDLDAITCLGNYSDAGHYKMPQASGFQTVYNLAFISESENTHILMGFCSCNRFQGEFRFGKGIYEIVLNIEGLGIKPGECWNLEEFFVATGDNREALFEAFAEQINENHPKLPYGGVPTGWCSWYCYGPQITERDIFNNLDSIAKRVPELEFIQIDDGYQPYMGDWLEPNPNFAGNIKELCLKIRERGFEPAIWVAPFIAVEESKIFKEHPDWFIKDESGNPLRSDEISFGGWRGGKWYMLDGTHPKAQEHLRQVFKTIRQEWKCKYFKLDANMWGAMLGGKRYDHNATRVQAYRAGMKAILEGAGEDSFILGCNAPMWPSLGTVHGMRVANDITRSWDRISSVARQVFWRNWQHGRLWINDPDAVVLQNQRIELIAPDGSVTTENKTHTTNEEFLFHAAFICASGGMVLSGDKIIDLTDENLEKLQKLLPPGNIAAQFDDASFRIGRVYHKSSLVLCLFNWREENETFEVDIDGNYQVKDYWTGENLTVIDSKLIIRGMKPHSARMLVCTR